MGVSLCSSDSEKELKHEVMDAGIKLCNLPSSINDLLKLLGKVEDILSQVGQDPSRSMRDAVSPSMKALVSDELLRHPNMDVKVSVVSCIHEIIRITAPCQPYGDEVMKEIFELTIVAFGMLSQLSVQLSVHCYSKALQILETVAKVRSCVMLLDLGCDALIVQIFELFLSTIRPDHPHSVFSNMEEVMTWLLDESDDISLELLKPLLASVKKENQVVSPISWKLGEEVLKCCSAKIQPYLSKAVKLMRMNFDDYSEIISSLCQDESIGRNLVDEDVKPDAAHLKEIGLTATKSNDLNVQKGNENNFILEDLNSLKTSESLSQLRQPKSTKENSVLKPETRANGVVLEAKTDGAAISSRRGRKPNSLVKPEEVCKQSLSGQGKNSRRTPHEKNNHQGSVNLAKNSSPTESPGTLLIDLVNSHNNQDHTHNDMSRKRRGRPKKDSTRKKGVPLGQAKENGEQNASSSIKMVSGYVEDAEEKPKRRGSRKMKSQRRSNRVAVPALSMIVPKKENDTFSDSEVKLYSLPDCINGTKATEKKASLRKRRTEKFDEKTMLSPPSKELVQDKNLSHGITKSKRRRKGALLEDEVSKRSALVKDYGEELVGSRIKVWWPLDQMFYEGIINSFHLSTKKHEVLYTDGDKEILNLNKERWILIDDDQDADPSTSTATPAKAERTKAEKIAKLKTKQDYTVSSAKRSSKSALRKSGSKSAESSAAICSTTRRKELSNNEKANANNVENDCHESLKG